MKTLAITLLMFLITLPASAGDWSLIASGQWLHKTGEDETEQVVTGTAVDFDFSDGAGIGVGLLYEFSTRLGIETKVSFAQMDSSVRTVLPDATFTLDLGSVKALPVTMVLQWRPLETDWRPYVGLGGAHIFLTDLSVPGSSEKFEFDSTTGLVVNGGLDIELSDQWFLNADVKYIPFETANEPNTEVPAGRVRFEPILASAGFRYRF